MKMVKKVVLCSLLATSAALLFAQTSNTRLATAYTFSTDVDNYLDVNNWNTVQPANMFAYSGLSSSKFDFGFAKQFKKFYLGAYYGGNLWGNNASNKTVDLTGGFNSISTTSSTNDVRVLFGVKNWGVKLTLDSEPNSSVEETYVLNTSVPSLMDTVTTTKNDKTIISLSAGTTVKGKKEIVFTPHFGITYENDNKSTVIDANGYIGTVQGSSTDKTNKSVSTFALFGGTGIKLKDVRNVSQNVNLDFSLGFISQPSVSASSTSTTGTTTTTSSTEVSLSGNYAGFTAAYVATITPATGFALKAKAKLPLTLTNSHTGNTTQYTNGNGVVTQQDISVKTITMTPTVALGVQYAVKPDKFILNAGLIASFLNFTKSTTVSVVGSTSSSYASTAWGSVSTGLDFGFGYYFVKNVGLDVSMNIFSGNTTSFKDIWEKQMSFLVSVKF